MTNLRLQYSASPETTSYAVSSLSGDAISAFAHTCLVKHVFEEGYATDDRITDFAILTLERLAILATGGFND
jgi:hypothetical protein